MQSYLLGLLERDARAARNSTAFDRMEPLRTSIPAGMKPEVIIREGRDHGFAADRGATAP
jgi:hypothetical protein